MVGRSCAVTVPAKAKVIEEARWLLSAYSEGFEELAQTDFAPDEYRGGLGLRDRGEYQRWMLDARGWAISASRAAELVEDDPYRDAAQTKVDRTLQDTASTVMRAVTQQDPATIRTTLAEYVNSLSTAG